MKNSNKCFIYGDTGHLKKDYPKAKDHNAPVPAKLNVANARDVARNNLP